MVSLWDSAAEVIWAADKQRETPMIHFADREIPHPAPPASTEVPAAILRALTYRPRAAFSPLLREALEECGCWTRERSARGTGLHLCLELPLYAVADLYSSLVECGLELERRAHAELGLMCTLRRHAIVPEALRRVLLVRLEITFADELEPETLKIPVAHA